MNRVFAFAFLAFVTSASSPAHAFSVRSAFTRSCHESITLAALVSAGDSIDLSRVPEPDTDAWENASRWALRDLDVELEDRRERFYYFSLLAGVRAPDTEGHSTANLDAVRAIHASPAGQYAHCLRAPDDDGPEGNARAARGCAEAFALAIDAARDAMAIEDARIRVPFALDHYGRVELEAWAPAYHLGRALHLLQDSFAHTVRTPDLHRIVHVMNFAEAVAGSLRRSRDGLPHSTATDRCDRGNAERVDAATEASSDLLVLTGTTPERVTPEALDSFVARWLSLDTSASDCSLEDGLCDSPWLASATRAPTEPILGCAAGGSSNTASGSWLVPLLAWLAVRPRLRASVVARLRSTRAFVPHLSVLALVITSMLASCVAPLDRAPLQVHVIDDGDPDGLAARVIESLEHPSAWIDVTIVAERATNPAELDALLDRWLGDPDADPTMRDAQVDGSGAWLRDDDDARGDGPRDDVPRLLVTTNDAHAAALQARGCLPDAWQGLHLGERLACPRVHVARLPRRAAGFLAGAIAADRATARVAIRDEGVDALTHLGGVTDGVAHRGPRQLVVDEAKSDPSALVASADVWLAGRHSAEALLVTAAAHDLRGERARLVLLDPDLGAAQRPEVLAVVRVNLGRVLRHVVRDAARGELSEGEHRYLAADGFVDVVYTGGRTLHDEDSDRDIDEDVEEGDHEHDDHGHDEDEHDEHEHDGHDEDERDGHDEDEHDEHDDPQSSRGCWDHETEQALRVAADASGA